MLFNFFHVFCIVSSLVFIIGSIQNWKRFEVIQKIPIYGNFAFLVFAIIEIIISKFTMNMSVPLLPFGGLLLFISLTIYTFKLYQLIEKRFKDQAKLKEMDNSKEDLIFDAHLKILNRIGEEDEKSFLTFFFIMYIYLILNQIIFRRISAFYCYYYNYIFILKSNLLFYFEK
jgi:hypothetical protein